MQHNIEQTIPAPIATSSKCLCFANLNIIWSSLSVMELIRDLTTMKVIMGTLTLPIRTSMLLLCLIKKVCPLALTIPKANKFAHIGINVKRCLTSFTCLTVQSLPRFSCSSWLIDDVSSIIAALSNHLYSTYLPAKAYTERERERERERALYLKNWHFGNKSIWRVWFV